MTKLFKALGATLLTVGLVFAGVVSPALAADLTPGASATATGTIGTTGTNAFPITISFTPITSGADTAEIDPPTGWTFVNHATVCASMTITSLQGSISCVSPANFVILNRSGTAFVTNSNALITVVFPVGSLNTAAGRDFTVGTSTMVPTPAPKDSGTATLASGATSYGANYSPNGGSGTSITPGSSSSGNITLPVCNFTKPGFTCAGWTSGAPNTGTVYAGGTSAPLTATTTFYASWTDNSATPSGGSSDTTLANTGIDSANGIMFLLGGLSLALIGAEMFMIARRKRSN
jgi:LPXTG-motif cell wall-anchored protein